MAEKTVLLAVIGAAHGIKGEVRIKSFTGDPLALVDYGTLRDAKGKEFAVTDIRPQGEVVVARIKGITDRNAAEALNGTELYIDRSRLPPEDEGEFYHDDLVGLSVQDETNAIIGRVTAVHNYGGGDVLEISAGDRKSVLIPFTLAAVPEVSISAGSIRIDSLAAGLVDDEDDDDPNAPGFDAKKRNRGPKEAGGNR